MLSHTARKEHRRVKTTNQRSYYLTGCVNPKRTVTRQQISIFGC
jgi:hypothetical protein